MPVPPTHRPALPAAKISLALACLFAMAGSAAADTVSGHVYDPDNKPAANMTFTAKSAKGEPVEFKTNASGVFSVYLDPGRYAITVSTDPSIQGVVESFPQPVQQDIHLKKGPR